MLFNHRTLAGRRTGFNTGAGARSASGRSRWVMRLAAATAASLFALPAPGQVFYNEPPDLGIATPVGTAAVISNVVTGGISATFTPLGGINGDNSDWFTFVVPAGLIVAKIELYVSNYNTSGPIFGVNIDPDSAGIGAMVVTGNGLYGVPITAPGGYLAAGTHGFNVSVPPPFATASVTMNYQFHITVTTATNDSCQLALPVAAGATNFSTTSATHSGPDHPTDCLSRGDYEITKDIWFRFTPPADGTWRVSLCQSSFDTRLAVYSGTCQTLSTTLISCNDEGCGDHQSKTGILQAVAGHPYLIRVGGHNRDTGSGILEIVHSTTGACCNPVTGGCAVMLPADCAALGLTFGDFGSTCTFTACTACPADFNGSGGLSVQDIFDFLASYFGGCP